MSIRRQPLPRDVDGLPSLPPITVTTAAEGTFVDREQIRALIDQLGRLITELRAIADVWAKHLDPAVCAHCGPLRDGTGTPITHKQGCPHDPQQPAERTTKRCCDCGDVIHLIDNIWRHDRDLRNDHEAAPGNLTGRATAEGPA